MRHRFLEAQHKARLPFHSSFSPARNCPAGSSDHLARGPFSPASVAADWLQKRPSPEIPGHVPLPLGFFHAVHEQLPLGRSLGAARRFPQRGPVPGYTSLLLTRARLSVAT